MSITIAKTAGFCYGVKRAVEKTLEAADRYENIGTLGSLIHNRQVVDMLQKKGVGVFDSVSEAPPGTTLIIRTHGVGRETYDTLESLGINYIDLTCPFVAKIHAIVKKHYELGDKIIIIGDSNHPEVKGINGWCNNEALIFYDKPPILPREFTESNVCIVAQTTINKKIFMENVKNLKNACKSTIIFDTICSATKDRQEEASRLAEESDLMLVVGGRESSNTAKLFEISKRLCPDSYFIETFEDIPHGIFFKKRKIGITAGASTPDSIIEEVFRTMEEKIRNEENFAELFEQSGVKTVNNGDILDGIVIEVRDNEVIVDLDGFKYNGQLAADQLTDDPYLKPQDIVKEGDKITVYVVGVNDAEGKVVLSRKKLIAMESWNNMKKAFEKGEILTAKVTKVVKGGVVALANEYQVFIPARQISLGYIRELETLLNTELSIKLIDIDEKKKRCVGSARVILEAEKKAAEEKFWSECEVGKHYTGTVKSLTSFGAFVDIGGVDGLVHISELSWSKLSHPSEVVSVGDVIDVYVKDINEEKKKISLGFKKLEDNPWTIAQTKLNIGDTVKCTIVRIMPFGAFAQIIPGVDGLIHISQIADRRIEKPEDVLTIGDEVEAKITEINWETRKISLSIRALIAPAAEELEKAAPAVEESFDEEVPVDIEKFIAENSGEDAE